MKHQSLLRLNDKLHIFLIFTHRKQKLGQITNWNFSKYETCRLIICIHHGNSINLFCKFCNFTLWILLYIQYSLICSLIIQIEQRVCLLQWLSLENRIRSSPAAREVWEAELEIKRISKFTPGIISSTNTGMGAITD